MHHRIDDLFFQPKVFPAFAFLLCEMFYCLYFETDNQNHQDYLILAMELEYCLDTEYESAINDFFHSLLQNKQISYLNTVIHHPVVISFLLTHLHIRGEHAERPVYLHFLCEFIAGLSSLEEIQSPSLSLEEDVYAMKSVIKEIIPRSFPSLV